MGEELGTLFNALWNEVAWVHTKWKEYVCLYGTKPSRVALVNKAAPLFFNVVQRTLWYDTILHIARLTDPPKTSNKDNLTIQRLTGLLSDNGVAMKIDKLIQNAIEKSGFCRDWRNRRIAHSDLKLATEEGAKPLEEASRINMDDALKAIAEVLNEVSKEYMQETSIFDGGIIPGGVEHLLYIVNDGLKAEEYQREQRMKGEYREEDWESPYL